MRGLELQNKIAVQYSPHKKFELWSTDIDILTNPRHSLVFRNKDRIIEKLYRPYPLRHEKGDF